uniref:Uncharacterized protein n=1 Tax=Heterorhabditis bacteriophora TaxID=37862 RepID=A0A1I7XC02_HETBA
MDEFQLHCKVKTKYELEMCIFLSAGTSSSRKVLFPPKTPHYQPDAPEPMCTRFVLRAQNKFHEDYSSCSFNRNRSDERVADASFRSHRGHQRDKSRSSRSQLALLPFTAVDWCRF